MTYLEHEIGYFTTASSKICFYFTAMCGIVIRTVRRVMSVNTGVISPFHYVYFAQPIEKLKSQLQSIK